MSAIRVLLLVRMGHHPTDHGRSQEPNRATYNLITAFENLLPSANSPPACMTSSRVRRSNRRRFSDDLCDGCDGWGERGPAVALPCAILPFPTVPVGEPDVFRPDRSSSIRYAEHMDRADLQVSVAHDDEGTVVTVSGELDMSTAAQLTDTGNE